MALKGTTIPGPGNRNQNNFSDSPLPGTSLPGVSQQNQTQTSLPGTIQASEDDIGIEQEVGQQTLADPGEPTSQDILQIVQQEEVEEPEIVDPRQRFEQSIGDAASQSQDQTLFEFSQTISPQREDVNPDRITQRVAQRLDSTIDAPISELQEQHGDDFIRTVANVAAEEMRPKPTQEDIARTSRQLSDPESTMTEEQIKNDPTLNAIFGPQTQDKSFFQEIADIADPQKPLGQELRDVGSTVSEGSANLFRGVGKAIAGEDTEDMNIIEEGIEPGSATAVAGIQEGLSTGIDVMQDVVRSPYTLAEKIINDEDIYTAPDFESEYIQEFQRNLEEGAERNREIVDLLEREERRRQGAPDDDRSFIEKLEDPEFLFEDLLAKNAPQLAIGMVGSVAGGPGGAAGTITGGLTTSAIQEGGAAVSEARQTLRERGREDLADNERFQKSLFLAQAGMAAPLETIGLEGIARTNPFTQSIRKGMTRQFAREFTEEALTAGSTESITEMAQETGANVVKQTYDKNQPLFEGVAAAGLAGFGLGGGATTFTGVVEESVIAAQEGRVGLSIRRTTGQQPVQPQETESGVSVTPPTREQMLSDSNPQDPSDIRQEDITIQDVGINQEQASQITNLAEQRLQELDQKDNLTRQEVEQRNFIRENVNDPVALVTPTPTRTTQTQPDFTATQDTTEVGGAQLNQSVTPDEVTLSDPVQERIRVDRETTLSGPEVREINENVNNRINQLEQQENLTSDQQVELEFLQQNQDNPRVIIRPESPVSDTILRTQQPDETTNVEDAEVRDDTTVQLQSEQDIQQSNTPFLQNKVIELRNLINTARRLVLNHEARPLAKYVNKRTGQLPSTDSDTVFGNNTEEILNELGYETVEDAQSAVDEYMSVRDSIQETNNDYRNQIDSIKSELDGRSIVEKRVTSDKIAARRDELNELQQDLDVSDSFMESEIFFEEPIWMSDAQFANYKKRLTQAAIEAKQTKRAKFEVMETIREKDLQRTNAYREVNGYPPISEMSMEQLQNFEAALSQYEDGSVFLTEQQLEATDISPDIQDVDTLQQAIESFLKRINSLTGEDYTLEDIGNIAPGTLEQWTPDANLAQRNPFYQFAVLRTQTAIMEAEHAFLEIQEKVNELARKANNSRDRSMLGSIGKFLVPTHEHIVNYLEAGTTAEREAAVQEMTKEELDYAQYIEQYYSRFYDYLIKQKELKGSRFKGEYFTHVRRTFLEAWSNDGFMQAVKDWWNGQQEDKLRTGITNEDTGEVLSKSQFFRFATQRQGALVPSQNVTRVFKNYVQMAERKKALDRAIPEIDIYTDSLEHAAEFDNGLTVGENLREFMNEWLNNKKGQRKSVLGIKQNSKYDVALKIATTYISLHFIGLSLTAIAAVGFGEFVMTTIGTGPINTFKGIKRRLWDQGLKRLGTDDGKSLLKKAEPFIGRNMFDEISDPDMPIGSRIMKIIFGLMSQASTEMNKIVFLGTRTQEELESGEINPETLASLQTEAGRWRDMGGNMRSIFSSTSLGRAIFQFKSWAIPIMFSTAQNIKSITNTIQEDGISGLRRKEAIEMARAISVMSIVLMIGSVLMAEDEEDNFTSRLKRRIYRDALTFLGGINPVTFLSTPPLYSFLQEFAQHTVSVLKVEQYERDSRWGNKGDLKGLRGLQRQFTPSSISQFSGPTNVQDGTDTGGGGTMFDSTGGGSDNMFDGNGGGSDNMFD